MESENRKKFVELAEKRVNKAIKSIQLVGNLSNRTNYKYDEGDVKKIVAALKKEVDAVRDRFAAGTSDSGPTFKL
jgi:hypothetical protein